MNYGFVIDNRSCIGCHACSTACKAENEVPLGVNRTWVKYVDKGTFPNNRRSFQVTRCNHCANPPCVRICPVTAMYQRTDGIVEFDPSICIGCKACMQACPYDAIYMDPDTGTAAKCHFCSHRTELNLEPACVVVCPTQAITAGDLDDPTSRIAQLVSRENVSVRKPEQGTMPKLFYIDGDDSSLTPTASLIDGALMSADTISEQAVMAGERQPETQYGAKLDSNGVNYQGLGSKGDNSWADGSLWASVPGMVPSQTTGMGTGGANMPAGAKTSASGTPIRAGGPQGGAGWGGPIQYGDASLAEHMVQTSYNAQHKVPWHWQVPAYLVTKAIGSGAFIWMALLFVLGIVPFDSSLAIAGNLISLTFIGLTTALLVMDLDKPERFLYILMRPQWKSWLTRGAFILIGFSGVSGLWLISELGWLGSGTAEVLRTPLLWTGLVLAVLSAIYTAFLFGQAEGRDLWQSPLLPVHLFVQAMFAGAAAWILAFAWIGVAFDLARTSEGLLEVMVWALPALLLIDIGILLAGEFGMPHPSEIAARAAHEIKKGKYRRSFWYGAIGLGHVVPIALYLAGSQGWLGRGLGNGLLWVSIMSLASIIGLYLYEHCFVMAPQEVPNS